MINKNFFLDQHGCAKNQVDGELIISYLAKKGWTRTEDAGAASLIVINTCGFIESAKAESIASLMDARAAYPNAKIVLAGCLAERYHEAFYEELTEADGFFGNGDIARIADVVDEVFAGKRPCIVPPQKGVCCGERSELLSFKGSAYVKITEGCNNRCSFCAIPLIRGELRSRAVDDIVTEIQSLLARGVFEINLIGQDLASYGKDWCAKSGAAVNDGNGAHIAPTNGANREQSAENASADGAQTEHGAHISNSNGAPTQQAQQAQTEQSALARLLQAICAIKGDFWIRLLYIHPDNFPLDILPIIKADSRLLPYFDIPFQSGDDEIICAMNRRGTADAYVRLIDSIRAELPDAAIRTTFLVGFPGETDERFTHTHEFLTRCAPDWSGAFTYSKEDGTPAALMKGRVSKKAAHARKEILCKTQNEISESRLKMRLDKTYRILIEEVVPVKDGEETGFLIGRAWFQSDDVDGSAVIRYDATSRALCTTIKEGALINARICGINGIDVEGFLV